MMLDKFRHVVAMMVTVALFHSFAMLHGSDMSDASKKKNETVSIVFKSDNTTWVSAMGPTPIKPHKLKKETIDLEPGDYKVLGRKYGYKEYAIILQVRGGSEYSPIKVVCKSKGKETEVDWNKVEILKGSDS